MNTRNAWFFPMCILEVFQRSNHIESRFLKLTDSIVIWPESYPDYESVDLPQ